MDKPTNGNDKKKNSIRFSCKNTCFPPYNNFGYIGLIGSVTKRNKFYKRLEKLGHKNELINKIECPIGSIIGKSKDPEEISFSILSRIIEFKNFINEDSQFIKRQINGS